MIAYDKYFSYSDVAKPYKNWKEQIKDYMNLVDMIFQVVMEYRESQAQTSNKDNINGRQAEKNIDVILSGTMIVPDRNGIDIAERRVLTKAMQHIVSRERATLNSNIFLPVIHVGKVFDLTSFERFCMILSFIAELDRKYERFFGYLHGNSGEKMPTVGGAASIYNLLTGEDDDAIALMPSTAFFQYIMDNKQGSELVPRLSRPMRLNEKILAFLMDEGFTDDILEPCMKVEFPDVLPELRFGNEIQIKIRSILDNLASTQDIQKTAIYLYGLPGGGKRLQVKHAAKYMNMPLVLIDCVMLRKDIKKLDELLRNILRYTILCQGILCLYNFEALMPDDDESYEYDGSYILSRLANNVDVLFVLSAKECKQGINQTPYTFIKIPIDIPDDEKRFEVWQDLSKNMCLDATIDLAELSNKFRFSIGMIEKALKEASFESNVSGGTIKKDTLYQACIRQSAHQLEKKATKIKPAFTWDDLILPEDQKRTLMEACYYIKFRHVVLNQWGFDKKLPYGRGLGILFYGPPGTGKTMGAQVLANELNLEIYRIDLSQTVSKYIGETEKNLKEIFDEASQTSVILFFDEADSLFSKRGEVKEAHDRYANMETSYLLQRMEEYDGITILATNLLQNFDEAYRRRFKFLINFPMPDVKTRRQLWEKVFPSNLPIDPEVDLDFMAERFELSGSNIKNIAVGASFLAAGEGSKLKMKHLIKALKNEMTKAGKIVVKHDLGGYGDLL